jgi:hypothetical protein
LDEFAAMGVQPVAFLLPVPATPGHHHTTLIGGFLFLSHNSLIKQKPHSLSKNISGCSPDHSKTGQNK